MPLATTCSYGVNPKHSRHLRGQLRRLPKTSRVDSANAQAPQLKQSYATGNLYSGTLRPELGRAEL